MDKVKQVKSVAAPALVPGAPPELEVLAHVLGGVLVLGHVLEPAVGSVAAAHLVIVADVISRELLHWLLDVGISKYHNKVLNTSTPIKFYFE